MFSLIRKKSKVDTDTSKDRAHSISGDFGHESFRRALRGAESSGFIDWEIATGKLQCEGNLWHTLGYKSERNVNLSEVDALKERVHSKDVYKFECMIRRLINGKEFDHCQFRIQASNNKYIWLEIRLAASYHKDGQCRFLSGHAYDINKLKHQEFSSQVSAARYQRILESSSDGVWEWSAQSKGFELSKECWLQLGFTEEDGIQKGGPEGVKAWRERMHSEDGMRFDGMLERHIAYKEPFDIEYRVKAKDGSWRWIRARGKMSYDKRGDVDRMSGTNMDITDAKRLEEDVLGSKVKAEQANQAKSEFLSNMSHELRAPLNSIIGFTQLFELDNNLTQEQIDNISEIKSAGDHLLRLVGDVLDLAKIEAGGATITMEELAPIQILKESISLLKPQADIRGISIKLKTNGHDQLLISLDSTRIKQVILNLLSNAIKYNRDMGLVEITVSCPVKNSYRISIKDEGKGIPSNLHSKIFQPFNRLGAEQTDVEGTGIGLVITKQLVEKMGGKIGFSSNETRGSIFWVEFPLSRYEASEEQENAQSNPEDSLLNLTPEHGKQISAENLQQKKLPELTFSEKKNILYIEENLSNQRLVEQTLSRFSDVSLSIVGDALRGIFEARTHDFDTIIIDTDLPSMSGQDILDIIKNDSTIRNVPIISVSSQTQSKLSDSRGVIDFDYYLTKPLDLHEMLTLLQKILSD